MTDFDVAVIGGGFAGTLVAVQLARRSRQPLRIVMFDRAGAFGRGTAYISAADHCLLNVRAKAMGAFPDADGDFLRWLHESGYALDDPELGERFLPRRLYGEYLCRLLADCTGAGTVIERRVIDVADVVRNSAGYRLTLPNESSVSAAAVVLATGNLPPRGSGHDALATALRIYARNPWELLAGDAVARDADVFIVGTGLTSLDVLAHLDANAHGGRITMLSRHARFPLAHAARASHGISSLAPIAGRPRDVLRAVRRLCAHAAREGRTWHEVIDALRPQVNGIWQQWTTDDQRQFYRHLAGHWDVHRHRAPDASLAVRDELVAAQRLHLRRGALTNITRVDEKLRITFGDRDSAAPAIVHADVLVDCSGPQRDVATCGDALIGALIARKIATPGPLGIGLRALPDGRLLGAADNSDIYALGPPLRGVLAESSAVREIRVQARDVAESIIARLPGRATDVRSAVAIL